MGCLVTGHPVFKPFAFLLNDVYGIQEIMCRAVLCVPPLLFFRREQAQAPQIVLPFIVSASPLRCC